NAPSGVEDITREERHPAIRGILNAVGIAFSSTFEIFTCWNARLAIAHPARNAPRPDSLSPAPRPHRSKTPAARRGCRRTPPRGAGPPSPPRCRGGGGGGADPARPAAAGGGRA